MDFYDKYVQLCKNANETPSGAALSMGLSKPAVNGWKTRRSKPTDITKAIIADHFHVSVSYLEDDETPADPVIPESRQAFIEKVLSMSDAEFDKLVKLFELWNEGR